MIREFVRSFVECIFSVIPHVESVCMFHHTFPTDPKSNPITLWIFLFNNFWWWLLWVFIYAKQNSQSQNCNSLKQWLRSHCCSFAFSCVFIREMYWKYKLTIRNYIKWNRYHSENGRKVGWMVVLVMTTLRFWIMDKLLYDQVSLGFLPNTLKIKRAHRSTAQHGNINISVGFSLSFIYGFPFLCTHFTFHIFFISASGMIGFPRNFYKNMPSPTPTPFFYSDLFILFTHRSRITTMLSLFFLPLYSFNNSNNQLEYEWHLLICIRNNNFWENHRLRPHHRRRYSTYWYKARQLYGVHEERSLFTSHSKRLITFGVPTNKQIESSAPCSAYIFCTNAIEWVGWSVRVKNLWQLIG